MTMTIDFVRKPCGFLFLINIFRDSGKYYVGTVSSVVDSHINTAALKNQPWGALSLIYFVLFPCCSLSFPLSSSTLFPSGLTL